MVARVLKQDRKLFWLLCIFLLAFVTPGFIHAQRELAATLEVLSEGVEVQRVNTVNWISVKIEAIVGVGDVIRTNSTGRARITFFADGVDTDIEPDTEYRITSFEGRDEAFRIEAEVIVGQTAQRLNRLLDANSSYSITTPGMVLAARGTQFAIRVEPGGRSAMLVTEGGVSAEAQAATAPVDQGFGVRAASGSLSDVVPATSFETLDSALDGCTGVVDVTDDVSIIVRVGASLDFPRVGTIDPQDTTLIMGTTASGDWYRIPFRGGYGWILPANLNINPDCAGLRPFPDNYGPEDIDRYTSVGNPIEIDEIRQQLEATPEADPGA